MNGHPDTVPYVSTCAKVVIDGPGYHEPERSPQLLQRLDLSLCDCTSLQLSDLKALLSEHADVFALDPSELGCCGLVQHVIELGTSLP